MDYILFSHFQIGHKLDKKAYEKEKVHVVGKAAIAPRLIAAHAGSLRNLLVSTTGRRGLLVLFYDAGWASLLHDLERTYMDPSENVEIAFGKAMCRTLSRTLASTGLADHVHVVGAFDVFKFFRNASGQAARDMFKWFTGRSSQLLYDAPKVIDAILRIRSIENSLPVFRIDQDVLFPGGERWEEHREQTDDSFTRLFRALEESLSLFRRLQRNSHVGRVIFSCQYQHPPNGSTDTLSWSRAFATRVDPACNADNLATCSVAEQFFGLEWDPDCEAWRLNKGRRLTLTAIGAHPLRGMISGALMFLSPGLLVDLPPFSNVEQNVMWIDDHLRWALHKALGHLEGMPDDPWDGPRPGLTKWRHPDTSNTEAIPETARIYFVAFLLGCVFDRWIMPTHVPKLSDEEARDLRIATYHPPGRSPDDGATEFIRALKNAIGRSVDFDNPAAKRRLRRVLEKQALERVRTAATIWSQLPGSLIYTWLFRRDAIDPDRDGPPQFLFEQNSRAATLLQRSASPSRSALTLEEVKSSLNPKILERLQILMSGAIDYISWAVAWPTVMHMLRVAPPGSFPGDVVSRPRQRSRSVPSLGLGLLPAERTSLKEDIEQKLQTGAQSWGDQLPMRPAWFPSRSRGQGSRKEPCVALSIRRTRIDGALFQHGQLLAGPFRARIRPIGGRPITLEKFKGAIDAIYDNFRLGRPARLGVSFPFPCTWLPNGDAVPDGWTKEFRLQTKEFRLQRNEKPFETVRALFRFLCPGLTPVVIVNDAVALLLARDRSGPKNKIQAALVASAGVNLAAFVPSSKLPKVTFPNVERPMAVSFEIGSYIPNSLRGIDDEVDAYSRRPGTQHLEKITGDIYLERILARALPAPRNHSTPLIREISDRSLQALAAVLDATQGFLGPGDLSVAVGGRRVWGPMPGDYEFSDAYSWKFRVEDLQQLCAPGVTLTRAHEDSYLRGAAAAAWAFP